jgi:hypothetical protein
LRNIDAYGQPWQNAIKPLQIVLDFAQMITTSPLSIKHEQIMDPCRCGQNMATKQPKGCLTERRI